MLASQNDAWVYNILLEMYNNQIEYTRYEISKAMDVFLVSKYGEKRRRAEEG